MLPYALHRALNQPTRSATNPQRLGAAPQRQTGAICVGFTEDERCDAIQQLVLPNSVRMLAEEIRCPSGAHEFVCSLAGWWTRGWGSRVRYFSDPPNCDRWSTPQETLARRGGDCDDLAILGASLILASGGSADVVVGRVWSSASSKWEGHAWVEGTDRLGWFFFEATSPTGHHQRNGRPQHYQAKQLLRPGRCLTVR